MEAPSLRAEAPGASYGVDTAAPLSRAPIVGWHRRLLRVLRVGADDGTETRLMVLLGNLKDCLAVLGAVTAEGWRWCVSTPASIRYVGRLTRTVRVLVVTGEDIDRLNQVRPRFAGHTVLLWLADQEPDTLYERAPDLMSWARAVLDLRAPDVDWPTARKVLLDRAIASVPGMADNLRRLSRGHGEVRRQAAEIRSSSGGATTSHYQGFLRVKLLASTMKEAMVVLQKLADSQLSAATESLVLELSEDLDRLRDIVDENEVLMTDNISDEAKGVIETTMVDLAYAANLLVLREW